MYENVSCDPSAFLLLLQLIGDDEESNNGSGSNLNRTWPFGAFDDDMAGLTSLHVPHAIYRGAYTRSQTVGSD